MNKYVPCLLAILLLPSLGWALSNQEEKAAAVAELRPKVDTILATTPHKDWDRLPDGRVVIDINGYKIALKTDTKGLQTNFVMSAAAVAILNGKGFYATLNDVIQKPDVARALFSINAPGIEGLEGPEPITPETMKSRLWPRWIPLLGGPIFYAGGKDIYLGSGIAFQRPKEWWQIVECGSDQRKHKLSEESSGFFTFQTEKSPFTKYYCLPAAKRAFKTKHPLEIRCSGDACQAVLYGKTEHSVMIGYAFVESRLPQSEWIEFDRKVHEYFSHIILNEEIE